MSEMMMDKSSGGLIPSPLGHAIARRILLPLEDEWAFIPPLPENEAKQEIKVAIEQMANLKAQLNSALIERVGQINDWQDDFDYDHSSGPSNYFYNLVAYLDNSNGSASLFTMSQRVNLSTIVDDLGSEMVSSLEDLHGESWVDWDELKDVLLIRLRRRLVSELGLLPEAEPTDIAREWLKRGQPINVRTYDAKQLDIIEQNIEPREGRSHIDFLMTKFAPRQSLVEYDGRYYSEQNDSAVKALDEMFMQVELQEATIYPLGEEVGVDDITQELVDSGRTRAAFQTAEKITNEFEYGYLARRHRKLVDWKLLVAGTDKDISRADQEMAEIEQRLSEIETINGHNSVRERGSMVLKAIQNDAATRWDHGVVKEIIKNATGDHDPTHLIEFANLPGPLQLLGMALGGNPIPYDIPNRCYLLQEETLGLLRSADHIFGVDSDKIRELMNNYQPEITTE